MKKLSKEALSEPLFSDHFKKTRVRDGDKELTTKDYILHLLDQPLKDEPMTRTLSKQIDNIFDAFDHEEPKLEDADFNYLQNKIERMNINAKPIFDAVMKVFDTAEKIQI